MANDDVAVSAQLQLEPNWSQVKEETERGGVHMADEPLGSAVWEARGLYRLLSIGHTVEELVAVITVPPKAEHWLRSYAQENARDACWIEPAIKPEFP